MELARHKEERGQILLLLRQDYSMEMTSARALGNELDLAGRRMAKSGLQFHLVLLADSGYVRIWRAHDVPGWRSDRQMDESGDTIMFARLTPKGLHLIDGLIAADPAVIF
jgi:hypothetical protein